MRIGQLITWISLGLGVLLACAGAAFLILNTEEQPASTLPPEGVESQTGPSDRAKGEGPGDHDSGKLETSPWSNATPKPGPSGPGPDLSGFPAELPDHELIRRLTNRDRPSPCLIVTGFLKSESDQPLSNRPVSLRWCPGEEEDDGPWELRTKTDPEGFIKVALPARLHRSLSQSGPRGLVLAAAPDEGGALVWPSAKTSLPAPPPPGGAPYDFGTLHLQSPEIIASGRVLAKKEGAVPGAAIQVRRRTLGRRRDQATTHPPLPHMECRSKSDGRYELRGELSGGKYVLFAIRPGYAQPRITHFGRKTTIRLVKGASFEGRLLIPRELDWNQISVSLKGPCVPPLYSGRKRADHASLMSVPIDRERGSFSIPGLLPGKGTFSVAIKGHGEVLSIPLMLSEGQNTFGSAAKKLSVPLINEEIDLRAALYPAVFTVLNEEGAALAGATIRALAEVRPGQASEIVVTTDEEGRAELAISPKLPLTIIASHPSCSTRTYQGVRNGLEITLFQGTPVTLRVLGLESAPEALKLHIVAVPSRVPGPLVREKARASMRRRRPGSVVRLPRGSVLTKLVDGKANFYLAHDGRWSLQLWAALGDAPPAPLRFPHLGRLEVPRDGAPLSLSLDASKAIASSLMTHRRRRRR